MPDQPETSLQKLITYRVARLHAKLNASATRVLGETEGLTLSRWRILVILNAIGEGTLTEIARRTELDKGQLSRDIKKMIAEGLLNSKTDSRDMRQQTLTISDKGARLHSAAKPAMDQRQEGLRAVLSDREQELLVALIDKLETGVSEAEAEQESA